MAKERLHWIDIAKGLCMIAVIMGHTGFESVGFVYSFHLTTFFLLTGYTLRKTAVSADYLAQKFRRLMTPYFITCAAVVGMEVVNAILWNHVNSVHGITQILYQGLVKTFFAFGSTRTIGSVNLGAGIGAIWFLPAMFFALIFVQWVLRLKSKPLQALVALLMMVVAYQSTRLIWLPFSIQPGLYAVPFILAGKWLKEYEVLEKLKWWMYLPFLAAFLVGCHFEVAQGFYMVGCSTTHRLFTPLCALCSSLCVIGLSRLIRRLPPLEFVGRNSMMYLCIHLFSLNTLSRYRGLLRGWLHIPRTLLTSTVIELAILTPICFGLLWLCSHSKKTAAPKPTIRDNRMDILRALLIILMIIGHMPVQEGFRRFVYSFHMMAFVMVSGYFYKGGVPLGENLKKTVKSLSHYGVFALLYLVFKEGEWRTVLLGVSFTKAWLPDAVSVGPIYFVLLLFVTRLLYVFVDQIRNEWIKNGVVLGLLAVGVVLGRSGYWLPWTADGALVSLAFYHAAYYMRKYNVLTWCATWPAVYFPLACLWVVFIYRGSMELAVRRYGNPLITLAGVLAAFVILCMMCGYLATHLPRWMTTVLAWVGQSTGYILILHTVFGSNIRRFMVETLGLYQNGVAYAGMALLIQLGIGVACCLLITHSKAWLSRRTSK